MVSDMKNIAVLIDVYNRYGGACKAAHSYSSSVKDYGYNSYVVCNNTLKGEIAPEGVYELNSIEKCRNFLVQNHIDVIHYFKASKGLLNGSLFKKMVVAAEKVDNEIRILTTVCQQPSYGKYILTPFEIRHSDHILFIDKTAYNDPMFNFIPEERKSWIYLTASKSMIHNSIMDNYVKQNYETNNNTIVFGRGSTLNKCPKDTISIYDRIGVPEDKKFVVVGVPEEPNWFTKEVKKRGGNDIHTYPMQLPMDYLKIVSSFDILLYYLPKVSYSSRDGSLRDAMRLGLPVVVYGPPVLKETVINGVDGFYAETKDEFVRYAELLAKDASLRETMGRSARRLYFEQAPEIHWTKAYTQIIEDLLHSNKRQGIKCPLNKKIHICIIRDFSWLKAVISKVYNAIIIRF